MKPTTQAMLILLIFSLHSCYEMKEKVENFLEAANELDEVIYLTKPSIKTICNVFTFCLP